MNYYKPKTRLYYRLHPKFLESSQPSRTGAAVELFIVESKDPIKVRVYCIDGFTRVLSSVEYNAGGLEADLKDMKEISAVEAVALLL